MWPPEAFYASVEIGSAFFAFRTCLSCIVSPYRIETMIKQANRVPKKVQLQKYLSVLNQITSEIVEENFQTRTTSYYHPYPNQIDAQVRSFRRQGCAVRFVIPLKLRIKFKLNSTSNFQWNFGYSFNKLLISIHFVCARKIL